MLSVLLAWRWIIDWMQWEAVPHGWRVALAPLVLLASLIGSAAVVVGAVTAAVVGVGLTAIACYFLFEFAVLFFGSLWGVA